jgi:glycosyltransferase involved in cell wall biosynthesis
MHILLGSSSPVGSGAGINTYVEEVANALIEKGHTISLAAPASTNLQREALKNVNYIETNYDLENLDVAVSLYRYITENNVAGVINNDNALIQSLLPALPCPTVVVTHAETNTIGALAGFHHEWADYTVAISCDMQKYLVSRYGIPVPRCPVIYNGIKAPANFIKPEKSTNRLNVLFAGSYIKRKGADLVVKAIVKHAKRWQNIHLDWFGHVPDAIRRKLSAFPFVTLHGLRPRAELLECLKQADAFLMASRTEGCPMAMLEAMAFGVVPISSDGIGAMRWLVDSGRDGFICPLDDWANQTVNCLEHLRDFPQDLARMSQSVRIRFINNFQIERVADDLIALLNTPTLNRDSIASTVEILRWHRAHEETLLSRLNWRMGRLVSQGMLKLR